MPVEQLEKIADQADFIVAGYSFTKDADMRKIQKYIKLNHEIMFEVWCKNSLHGYYGENK